MMALNSLDTHLFYLRSVKETTLEIIKADYNSLLEQVPAEKQVETRLSYLITQNKIDECIATFTRNWIDAIPEIDFKAEDSGLEFEKNLRNDLSEKKSYIIDLGRAFSAQILKDASHEEPAH